MLGSGGIGTYLQSILPYLFKAFDCTLLLKTKDISSYENIPGIKILECNIPTFSIKEIFNFPPELLKKINSTDAYYSPYCNIPGGIKIPVFTTIHDVVFLDVKGLSSKIGTLARKYFYRRAINKSKLVFTVSKFSEERIKANLKTKKTPIVVTYNSVPEWFLKDGGLSDFATPGTQTSTTSQNTPATKEKSLLFVGNIKKHKGLHILLQAFLQLQKRGFDGKLIIVGNADNFRTSDDSILSQISTIPNITFTGRISDDDLKSLYHKVSLLVQPSLYEGFGMPPLEALTCGTNVVLSDIPVFKEIYKDFPVTFFKQNDSEDLCDKILKTIDAPAPRNLPEIYSFKKTSAIIVDSIKNFVQK